MIEKKCHILSLKSKYLAEYQKLKNKSCNRNEPKQYISTWQIIELSNSTKQLIAAEIMQTYDLLKFALARSNGSSFLHITQYEMPFINTSEATKKVERPKNKRQIYK